MKLLLKEYLRNFENYNFFIHIFVEMSFSLSDVYSCTGNKMYVEI